MYEGVLVEPERTNEMKYEMKPGDTARSTSTTSVSGRRRLWAHELEYIGGSSRKFWKIRVEERIKEGEATDPDDLRFVVVTNYGKIGTTGQFVHKGFSYRYQAVEYERQKYTEKVRKGYRAISNPTYVESKAPVHQEKEEPKKEEPKKEVVTAEEALKRAIIKSMME